MPYFYTVPIHKIFYVHLLRFLICPTKMCFTLCFFLMKSLFNENSFFVPKINIYISDAHVEFDNTVTLLSRNRNSETFIGFRGFVDSSEHYFIFIGVCVLPVMGLWLESPVKGGKGDI